MFSLGKSQCLSLYFLLLSLTLSGAAMAAESPSQTLQSSIDLVLETLKKPEYRDPQTRPSLRARIEQEVDRVFDFAEFSARTVSSYWSSFNPDQKKRFVDTFSDLLIATYLNQVDGYNGEKISYLEERFSADGSRAEVHTTITLASNKVVPVNYRLLNKEGQWRIYDVLVENVGLTSNYRSQFKEILLKSTPEDLIRRVEERVLELKTQDKQS